MSTRCDFLAANRNQLTALAATRPLIVVSSLSSETLEADVFVVGAMLSDKWLTTNVRGFDMPKRPTNRAS